MTNVTVTLSAALKSELEALRDREGYDSLNATIMALMENPREGERPLTGRDDTLTEPVAVSGFTRHVLRNIRDEDDHPDYEAVIRARGGYEARDLGEQPIEVATLG